MLRSLFTQFDKLCLQFDVYKLYTIGDCYVVLGLFDARDRNPPQEAKNVVEMGFSMIRGIRRTRKEIGYNELDMRIGIHTVVFYWNI
jgi:class 3 adenylate cyclase